jgi:hypothetical protein
VSGNEKRGMGEAIAVLGVYTAVALAILVTYTRTPTDELYNVSIQGIGGGLGRMVVFLNFSTALVAIPIALIAAGRLDTRGMWALAMGAVTLSAVVLVPGVVKQSDLDVRPVNAVPAAGVLLTAVLVAVAIRRAGGAFAPRRAWDPVRFVIAVVLVVGSVPWLLAELGVSLDGVPVLGSIWQTGELRLQPGHPVPEVAVHHGHHHGLDGSLLALAAIGLSRMTIARLRWVVGGFLALMFSYGLANAIQDWWLEQVVKRGWTDTEIPSMILPRLTVGWGAIVLGALLLLVGWAVVSRPSRRLPRTA